MKIAFYAIPQKRIKDKILSNEADISLISPLFSIQLWFKKKTNMVDSQISNI